MDTAVEVHPAAALFPMLTEPELDQLAADIRERGLIQALVATPDGVLLDGRNRLEGCRRAGVTPRWTTYTGDDPTGYVMSVNLERRHLSEDQRAFLAVDLIRLFEADARARMLAGVPANPAPDPEQGSRHHRSAAAHAARATKVTKTKVTQAKRVAEHAPDLVAAVKAGKVSMTKAERMAGDRAAGLTDADRDDWYTPTWLFDQLGLRFDLDVCAPADPKHRSCPAGRYFTEADDGLAQPWEGLVWCNPPYSKAEPWADRMIAHGNGIMLTHVPIHSRWFVRVVDAATSRREILKVGFTRPNGSTQVPGYALVLTTYGEHLRDALLPLTGDEVSGEWLCRMWWPGPDTHSGAGR